MKYRLLKPLPGIEVGTIYDSTKEEADIELFVRCFGTNNDFFEPIKESKWWEPKEWGEYYDFYGEEEFNNTKWDVTNISAGLAFKTKEEAEKQLKLMQAITRCKRYLVENDFISISNGYLVCINNNSILETYSTVGISIYTPYGYINSKTNCDKFIKDCQEDLLLIHKPC